MNIPDEVIEDAEKAMGWPIRSLPREAAYQVIAEWARREALREAADVATRIVVESIRDRTGDSCSRGRGTGMTKYIPSTKIVRGAYVEFMRNAFIASTGELEQEFDRWLAEHDRNILFEKHKNDLEKFNDRQEELQGSYE